jgi:FAD/FMN-containing dehydrogenase
MMVGSEGTLGMITAVDVKLMPAVEARHPIVGFYATVEAGCEAIEAAMASGTVPSAIEYLDGATMAIAGGAFPVAVPDGTEIVIVGEADGSVREAAEGRELLAEALSDGALAVHAPEAASGVDALWRWREGVGLVVAGHLGGKLSEDVAVPVDRLADAIQGTLEIARRHGLEGCSWGHAGDGNLHSTFMVRRTASDDLGRAHRAIDELFGMAIGLGGTISGEHGVGIVKGGQLRRQWSPAAVDLHEGVKRLFDPSGVFNPGKKRP